MIGFLRRGRNEQHVRSLLLGYCIESQTLRARSRTDNFEVDDLTSSHALLSLEYSIFNLILLTQTESMLPSGWYFGSRSRGTHAVVVGTMYW